MPTKKGSAVRRRGSDLRRLNAQVAPGEEKKFDAFTKPFRLTDIVMDLWTFPDGLDSKASCGLWLVNPAQGTSEILFQCWIDKYGHQIHLNTGVLCPKGSYLSANGGVFAEGQTADLRILMTGADS
jgi:hypothetical protein